MICSECNKNPAVIFYEKTDDGKKTLAGLCYDCAKKKGIDATEVLARQQDILSKDKINLNDMNKQLESIFKDLAENIDINNLENIEGAITFGNVDEDGENEDDEERPKFAGAAIPLGSIFSNMFNGQKTNSENQENESKKTIRVEKKKNVKQSKKKKFLDTYGTNLTNKAKNNELDLVIGRDKEIQRVIQILNRRSKNNPCLIGEPGVGKTAIAQGLAIKIANQNVPAKLLNKEVYLLDMTSVIAGTQFRGQFESRMKGIIDECKEYGNIILVIDEIHNIIGAGDGEHSMNAANILKPSLSNGEIQLIGTTTLTEYRKYIEKDTALERRFQQVLVEEPNIDDSIHILEGIKKYYEEYHKVKISTDVIKQTVIMSEKYIHDRFLPDKAIDILDEACSRINLENKDLYQLEMLKQELKNVQAQKEEVAQADTTEDYQKAADLKTKECKLIEEIDKINKKMKPRNLTIQDIATVIESWTKIPVKKITEAETQKLLNLETNLHKRVIGQEEAVNAVSRAIRRNRAGLQNEKRPPSFIFVGPTGVGKTELAKSKALAEALFGDENAMIRIDMSEYMESHSTSKLIGAPPGYVGYDDAGQLTEKVKRKPYSIILLDEIEKAHPDVFNILLQVLDDGRITDSQGRTVDFKNTIIILTSNLGSEYILEGIEDSGEISKEAQDKVNTLLKQSFRPEFLNRLDEIVFYKPLKKAEISKILDLLIIDLEKRLEDKHIRLELTDSAKNYLIDNGYDEIYGARPLKRFVQKKLETLIAKKILTQEILPNSLVTIDCVDNELCLVNKKR